MSKNRTLSLITLSALVAVLIFTSAASSYAKGDKMKESYRAIAVSTGTMAPGLSSFINVTVTRWSTEEDEALLTKALEDGGTEALWAALQKQEKTGVFSVPGERGYRMRYAAEIENEGGRTILMATDREIEMEEFFDNSMRTNKYNISLIEMRFPKGEEVGTGSLILGAELYFNNTGDLVVKNFDSKPMELRDVKKSK